MYLFIYNGIIVYFTQIICKGDYFSLSFSERLAFPGETPQDRKKNTSTHILLILFLLLSCRLSSSLYMGIIKETTTINLKTRVYKYNFPYYRVFLFSRVCDCGYNVQQISLFKLSMRYDRAWRLCILLRGTVVADVWMWCCHQCSCLLAGGSGWLCVTW